MIPLPWYPTTEYANYGKDVRIPVLFIQLVQTGHTYALRPKPGAMPTGKLANKPMRPEARADMAAVVVIRSTRTSLTQAR